MLTESPQQSPAFSLLFHLCSLPCSVGTCAAHGKGGVARAGGMEFSAEHFGRLDFPPSILGRELLVPSCAHAIMPGFSRLTPQVRTCIFSLSRQGKCSVKTAQCFCRTSFFIGSLAA